MAATDTEPIARCSSAAMNQASRMDSDDRGARVDAEQAAEQLRQAGRLDDGAERAADAGDEQDLAGGLQPVAEGVAVRSVPT
jgi:hypothetical protein